MPPLLRKILIIAAIDGVLLQPTGPRSRTSNQTKIHYKDASIASSSSSDSSSGAKSASITIEAYGIAGLLKMQSGSWLIAITRRDLVAEIKGRQIYVVGDIVLIPLNSKSDAEAAIQRYKQVNSVRSNEPAEDVEETDEEDQHHDLSGDDEVSDDPTHAKPQIHKRTTSVAEDVIGKKGVYGRFAERWFSKRGWQVDQKRSQGISTAEEDLAQRLVDKQSSNDSENKPVAPALDAVAAKSQAERKSLDVELSTDKKENKNLDSVSPGDTKEVTNSLTPKLLRTLKIFFAASRSFYFSYDYDITRSLKTGQLPSSSSIPLHKLVNQEYFWNSYLMEPFIEAHQDHLVLPMLQGFIAQSSFKIPSDEGTLKNFVLTLMSRRSTKRAGLRYLRRGIDDEGNVANFVETEQVLHDIDTGEAHSFVQTRGSIPVFFQQSPYALKPKPVLMHNEELNKAAFKQHFKKMVEKYGDIQAISLVEKHSQEGVVGDMYEKLATEMSEPKIGFEWFDFHAECRGMKFENVSRLLDNMQAVVEEFGWTTLQNEQLKQVQKGVLRTNCMDCLDRTNVVQSACARKVLLDQLLAKGIDKTVLEPLLGFVNMLWADNGDAISKQYSSTAALKGDFTRTKKRNFQGALTDFGLSVTRYWNNIIGDFFTQAAIDFLLGNVSEQVFVEFEANMMSGDPAISIKKVRQNAIETSAKIVVEDIDEEMIGGWVMLAPAEDNTTRTQPFQETVLLLTDAAIYFCRFDFTMEKVMAFERILLRNIEQLQYGTYITSTLTSSSTDPKQNVGFVIIYAPGKKDLLRINTRSLTSTFARSSSNFVSSAKPQDVDETTEDETVTESSQTRILAFKALPKDSSIAHLESRSTTHFNEDEETQVLNVCHEIERACKKSQVIEPQSTPLSAPGSTTHVVPPLKAEKDYLPAPAPVDTEVSPKVDTFVVQKDVISLQQAKKQTNLLEQVGYSLKRLVWA